MKKLILFLFILLVSLSYGQIGKEAWHWQFGYHFALDFSSGMPVMDTAALVTREGSASISDPNTGQLLFYSDGVNVYDRYDAQMPNGFGLIGSGTSTQVALIVPMPCSKNIFYLFTSDQGGYYAPGTPNKGVFYSVVDMNLRGGLGDVTIKNHLLTPPPATEKLVGVKHRNGRDYWVITHSFNSNQFNAYQVTQNGISGPIISNIGSVHTGTSYFNATIGYLKASPDGAKIASAVQAYPKVELFDFDNQTGLLSNMIRITYPWDSTQMGAYGVSFSPDNSKLYTLLPGVGKVFQYDLSNYVDSVIYNSETLIAQGGFWTAQIAPNGRIYVSAFEDTMAVINSPNSQGAACGFQKTNIFLLDHSITEFGLPNFMDGGIYSYLPPTLSISDIQQCNNFLSDTLHVDSAFVSFNWSTGDTSSVAVINSPGMYWLQVTDSHGCVDTDTVNAFLLQPQRIDTSFCGNVLTLDVSQSGAVNYLWSDSISKPVRNLLISGNYLVDISYAQGCTVTDSINLLLLPEPPVDLGNDISGCYTFPFVDTLMATSGNSYVWNTGETTQQIVISTAGEYWVTVYATNGCASSDSILIDPTYYPVVHLGSDTAFCKGEKTISALNNSCNYIWNTGQTTSDITIHDPGIYWVVVDRNGCNTTDTLTISPDFNQLTFEFPNVITPNADEINDYFDFNAFFLAEMNFEVFNRWGNKIFSSNDVKLKWAPDYVDGTYFYILNYKASCGNNLRSEKLNGFISIIR